MFTVQVLAVPVQAPLQPANNEPALADAVSVTVLLRPSVAAQLPPQSISGGLKVSPVLVCNHDTYCDTRV